MGASPRPAAARTRQDGRQSLEADGERLSRPRRSSATAPHPNRPAPGLESGRRHIRLRGSLTPPRRLRGGIRRMTGVEFGTAAASKAGSVNLWVGCPRLGAAVRRWKWRRLARDAVKAVAAEQSARQTWHLRRLIKQSLDEPAIVKSLRNRDQLGIEETSALLRPRLRDSLRRSFGDDWEPILHRTLPRNQRPLLRRTRSAGSGTAGPPGNSGRWRSRIGCRTGSSAVARYRKPMRAGNAR